MSLAFADGMWTKVDFSGGDIRKIASFPQNPNIILACVRDHGVFKSIDRGKNWSQIVYSDCYDISISEDNVAFIASSEGLLVSGDTGNTWEARIDSTAWHVTAYRDGIVTADTRTNVRDRESLWLLSTDYGLSWEPWAGTQGTVSVLFHDSGVVYRNAEYYDMGTHFNIFRSSESDWTQWTNVGRIERYGAKLFFPSFSGSDSVLYGYSRYIDWHPGGYYAGGVFRSDDNGESWSKYTSPFSVTALEKTGNSLIIGSEDGTLLLHYVNTQETITLCEFGGSITGIDARTLQNGELIVATRGGIFRTEDMGQNWNKSDTGINYPEIAAVQVVSLNDAHERIIMSTKQNGIYYSDDSGEHWISADQKVKTGPGLLVASDQQIIYSAESKIYVSRDNGKSWNEFEMIPAAYYGWYGRTADIDIDPRDSDRIVVNYYDHSLDDIRGIRYVEGNHISGINQDKWEDWDWNIPEWLTSRTFRSQFSSDGNLIWISIGSFDDPPLLIGVDAETGALIHEITVPYLRDTRIWHIDGQNCYLFNEITGNLWISHDLGVNWTSINISLKKYAHYQDSHIDQPIGAISISQDKKYIFLLYPGNGILISEDSGYTWRDFNEGLTTDLAYHLTFSSLNQSIAYIATIDGLYKRDMSTVNVLSEDRQLLQKEFSLTQPYPNPFNPSMIIEYSLPEDGHVTMTVYNVSGQVVGVLKDEYQQAGKYSVTWNASDMSSGLYFCTLKANGISETRKMMVVR